MPRLLLNDEHWSKLREILLHKAIYNKRDLRMTVEGMLYRMRTGCPWRDLSKAFGNWNKVYTRDAPSGRLRINAPVTFGIRVLSPRLLEYMVRYPQVSVDLTLSNELVDIVDHGYDVVFRIGELQASGLKAMPLEPYP